MRNLKLTLSYDGTDFCGWQVQPDRPTVKQAVTEALARITGERPIVHGSGRTDAGVHALEQVANVAPAAPLHIKSGLLRVRAFGGAVLALTSRGAGRAAAGGGLRVAPLPAAEREGLPREPGAWVGALG